MKRRVRLAPRASRDLARLEAFLGNVDPAARRMVGILGDAIRSLDDHADRGRPGPRPGLRELALSFGSGGYVLRYQVREGEIVFLRVWHSREQRS